MELVKSPVIKIEGELYTSFDGVNKLMQFYKEASSYRDCEVIIDFYNMDWIDANLTALLYALHYRLHRENNIILKADFSFLAEKFNVLFRNGWLTHEDYIFEDIQNTTIPCSTFLLSQENEFIEYIDSKLLCHRGTEKIDSHVKKRIKSDLIEIFQNLRHAKTEDPCFICGQFYPTKNFFILTMIDLGVGFLPPIQEYTNGTINTDIEAIRWALSGKSILVNDPSKEMGGLGLEGILQYCRHNNGVFQIYTGQDFWGTDLENTIWQGYSPLKHRFQGSMLNLFFNFKK